MQFWITQRRWTHSLYESWQIGYHILFSFFFFFKVTIWAVSCISSNPINFQSDAAWVSSQSASQWELMASGKVAYDRLSFHTKKIGNASKRVNGVSRRSLGPCQQLSEKYLQNILYIPLQWTWPSDHMPDCSGHRKIRSDVNTFLQCPPTSGGAIISELLLLWMK